MNSLENLRTRLDYHMLRAFVGSNRSILFHKRFFWPSFSQDGEDMVLRRYLEGKKAGFYVDVGAYHPFRFSNTCYFYLNGWKGMNIDAMPGSSQLFNRYRKRDINLEAAISASAKELDYYMFNEPAINCFNVERSSTKSKLSRYKLEKIVKIPTHRLCDILDRHLPPGMKIDLISVDVEGSELDVLESNDWNKYRPSVVAVEELNFTFSNLESSLFEFFRNKGYGLVARTHYTSIYKIIDN